MKKVFVAILAFLYLGSSVGATVHLHYCMNKLVSWGFGENKSNKKACPFCGMAKKTNGNHCARHTNGCCKDEQKFIKVEKDQKASVFGYSFLKHFDDLISYSVGTTSVYNAFSPVLEYTTSHAPPFKEKVPVFIRNCVFRI